MTLPQFRVWVKGEPVEFTSAFATLAEAYDVLVASGRKNDFVLSLLAAARARSLSDLQVAWLHKLATDAQKPARHRFQEREPVEGLNLLPIVRLLERAAGAQKRRPRISLRTPDQRHFVVLQLAGEKSKAPGSVSVTTGVYPSKFYARIGTDGAVVKGGDWVEPVGELLSRLAEDPAKVASQHGVATGECCFCHLPLSTAESRSVGYGPICADKYGLPWGNTDVADAADKDAKAEAEKLFDGLKFDEGDRR